MRREKTHVHNQLTVTDRNEGKQTEEVRNVCLWRNDSLIKRKYGQHYRIKWMSRRLSINKDLSICSVVK